MKTKGFVIFRWKAKDKLGIQPERLGVLRLFMHPKKEDCLWRRLQQQSKHLFLKCQHLKWIQEFEHYVIPSQVKKKDLLQNKICNQASNINKVINQQSSKSLSASLRMASVLKHLHNLFFTDPVLNKMLRLKKKDRNHCT